MENKKKILIVFGTRPEAIKFAPLIKAMRSNHNLQPLVCSFGQQGGMTDSVLETFNIKPDYKLHISLSDRSIFGTNIFLRGRNILLSGWGLLKFVKILRQEKPDILMIQGDTSTALLASLIAFHYKTPIAHLEAGLRTYQKYSPFPEEMYRQLISRLADFHFAPTEKAKENLLKEGISSDKIWVTGNTVLDAVRFVLEKEDSRKQKLELDANKKMILVTVHRRESFGEGIKNITEAVKSLAAENPDVNIILPVHTNPFVRKTVKENLSAQKNVSLIEPVDYEPFVNLMKDSHIILTDSGGIQEEVSFLGKPVLVMRNYTERQEGISAGNAILVGIKKEDILREANKLLHDNDWYKQKSRKHTEYGDGHASENVIKILES